MTQRGLVAGISAIQAVGLASSLLHSPNISTFSACCEKWPQTSELRAFGMRGGFSGPLDFNMSAGIVRFERKLKHLLGPNESNMAFI